MDVDDHHDELLLWRWAGGGSHDVRTYRSPLVMMDRDVPCTWEIVSVTECKGRFYLMHKHTDVRQGCLVFMSTIDATTRPPHRMVKLPAPGRAAKYGESYPLESDGEILLVLSSRACKEVECSSCGHSTRQSAIDGFEVYMLGAKDKRWRKVEKLAGDRALFVSPKSSFALRAPETVGCMSNCVYFIRNNRHCSICKSVSSENTWGVYSLEDEKILCEHAFTTKEAKWTTEFWFLPSVVYS